MDPLQQPAQNSNQPSPAPAHNAEKKIGPIVGIVIIIVLLLIAAIYFWGRTLNNRADTADNSAPIETTYQSTTTTTTTKTTEEARVDSEVGTDGLDSLNDLEF